MCVHGCRLTGKMTGACNLGTTTWALLLCYHTYLVKCDNTPKSSRNLCLGWKPVWATRSRSSTRRPSPHYATGGLAPAPPTYPTAAVREESACRNPHADLAWVTPSPAPPSRRQNLISVTHSQITQIKGVYALIGALTVV